MRRHDKSLSLFGGTRSSFLHSWRYILNVHAVAERVPNNNNNIARSSATSTSESATQRPPLLRDLIISDSANIAANICNTQAINSKNNKPPEEHEKNITTNNNIIERHRSYFDKIAAKLNIRQPEDWYHITTKQVKGAGGSGLLINHYAGSLIRALSTIYPQYDWIPWRFNSVPARFWNDLTNQRKFFEWAAKQLDVQRVPEDWYTKSTKHVQELGGAGLLKSHYNNSLSKALAAVYPQYEWLPWRFSMTPDGFWHDLANQRKFLEWAATQDSQHANHQHNYHYHHHHHQTQGLHVEALRNLTVQKIVELGGRQLLHLYNHSLTKLLSAVYPEVEWGSQQRPNGATQKGFWSDVGNQRKFLESAAKQLGIIADGEPFSSALLSCWYKITTRDLQRVGGSHLLSLYGSSLFKMLSTLYPEYEWLPWRFSSVPDGYWTSIDNQRKFFDWVAKALDIHQMQDWYKVRPSQVRDLGGSHILLQHHGNSMVKALATVYPEFAWEPWRFEHCNFRLLRSTTTSSSSSSSSSSHNDDDDEALLRRYVEFLERELHIVDLDDWHRVTMAHIQKGRNIILRNGGLYEVLRRVYPKHPWDRARFIAVRGKRATQRLLKGALQNIFIAPSQQKKVSYIVQTVVEREQ